MGSPIQNFEQIHLLISGRVQGVNFRNETRQKALSLGLTGWVKNTDDGKVELIVEGVTEKCAEFVLWCHRGPAFARVTSVVEIDRRIIGVSEYQSFSLRF